MIAKTYELQNCINYVRTNKGFIDNNICKMTDKPCRCSACKIKTAIVNYHNKGVDAENVGLFIDVGFSCIKHNDETYLKIKGEN